MSSRSGPLPRVMRAAVTVRHGGLDAIEFHDDWPCPIPGIGEVLVRVTAAAVNNTDLWSRRGAYGTTDDPHAVVGWLGVPLSFPLIQGADIAGVVVAVGDGVDGAMVGRRILVDPAIAYDGEFPVAVAGSEADGGYAEYHLADAARVHDVHGSPLTDAQLACLPIAYGTAMAMVERAECLPGERVLVTGASGGVGLAATQILSARGCVVVAMTSIDKVRAVRDSGATEVVVRGTGDLSLLAEVDAVVEVVGGSDFGAVVDSLRSGGRLVVAGAIAGPVVSLDLRRVYLRQRRIIGSTMHTPEHFRRLAGLARTGAVSPVVAATYRLDEVALAQTRFEAKDFVGKLVLLP